MTAILTSIFVISRYISPILFDMKQIWPIFQNRAACTIMYVPPSLRIETAAYEKESYMFSLSKYFGSTLVSRIEVPVRLFFFAFFPPACMSYLGLCVY